MVPTLVSPHRKKQCGVGHMKETAYKRGIVYGAPCRGEVQRPKKGRKVGKGKKTGPSIRIRLVGQKCVREEK